MTTTAQVPFVTQLRASRPAIAITAPGAGVFSIRVTAADVWDTVRITARPETTVDEVKRRAVAAFYSDDAVPDDFVVKLRGWEMLDERASLAESGVLDGSTILLAYRRRRPLK